MYGLLTDLFDILGHKDDLTHLLYDDMCHLKKFSEDPKRANLNDITQKMAGLSKYVDRFHFRNHVDRWCHDNCNPDVDSALKGEQSFKKNIAIGKTSQAINPFHYVATLTISLL